MVFQNQKIAKKTAIKERLGHRIYLSITLGASPSARSQQQWSCISCWARQLAWWWGFQFASLLSPTSIRSKVGGTTSAPRDSLRRFLTKTRGFVQSPWCAKKWSQLKLIQWHWMDQKILSDWWSPWVPDFASARKWTLVTSWLALKKKCQEAVVFDKRMQHEK